MKNLYLTILAVALSSLAVAVAQSDNKQPNILFILADDLGMGDVGFMGSQYFETPNLDALAKESLVFNQAYMYPTCSPSRAAILTGRQSFRTGCYTVPVLEKGKPNDNIFSRWTVTEEHPAYSQPLTQAGYQLIHLGKWHVVGPDPLSETKFPLSKKLSQPKNGSLSWFESHQTPEIKRYYPEGRGFHKNVGGTWWGDPARGYSKGYAAPGGGYIPPFKNPYIKDQTHDEWLTDRLTSDTISFIEQNKEKPFFINLHYYSPHRPSVARNQALLDHFLKKSGDPISGQGMSTGKKKMEIAAYATMIKSIDDNIKRLTDYLDQSGLRKNTLILFTSDNGFNGLQSRNQRLKGAKGNVYEGGIRVPALANWPETIEPGQSETPIHGLDFFPTFIDLAGVSDYTSTLDGDSLVPLFKGDTLDDRALFWHIASTYKDPPCSIIRKGPWKLIQFLKKGNVELYNLEEDLKESKNLADQNTQVTQRLLKELTEWRKANNVPLTPSSTLKF